MKSWLKDVIGVAGCLCLLAAAFWVHPVLALVLLGFMLCGLAWLLTWLGMRESNDGP